MKNFCKWIALVWLLILLCGVFSFGVMAENTDAPLFYDATAEGILSSFYPIDREAGYLLGVAPGTSPERLCSTLVPAATTLSTDAVGTGSALTYTAEDGSEATLTVVVTGDLNGDAAVTITDMLMIKSHILGEALDEAASVAGDVNYDGGITITDFLQVKSNLLGMTQIAAKEPATAEDPNAVRLLTPAGSDVWTHPSAASYSSQDPALVTIDADGTITSVAGLGSTFVYALDEAGNPIARILVTVLDEPLTVSLDSDIFRVQISQSIAPEPQFNHPVSAPVTWASSDTAIATVDEAGNVTGHSYGTATITASLASGSSTMCEVIVCPPITAIDFEKSLYKVKPGNTRSLLAILSPSSDVGEELIWTSSDPSIVTVDSTGTVTGVSYGTATITVTGKYSGLTASCDVKICDVKQVAITFDDGPSSHTTRLLDYLKEVDVKATFFLVGERLTYYKDIVIRQAAEGHEIGYHSYNHTIQTTLSDEKIISDFEYTNNLLKEITGQEFTVWRTPGGGFNQRVLNCIPLPHIYWWVDTRDWESLNADKVYNNILKYSSDGSIILLHDLYRSSVEGAIRAMDVMLEGDYEFLTVTELLSRDGTPPEPCVDYKRG